MPRYFPDPRDTQPGTEQSAELMRNTISQSMKQINPSSSVGVKRFGDNLILKGNPVQRKAGNAFLYLAKFASLNSDGNTMEVYLYTPSGFQITTTTILKPLELQAIFWNGKTLVNAEGKSFEYDAPSLDIKYQRRASWYEGIYLYHAVEEITPQYVVDGLLYVLRDPFGNMIDDNNLGRNWGVNGDSS